VINKQVPDWQHALEGLEDGAVVMIGGFGPPGQPEELIEGLLEKGVRNLTVVNNNAGAGGEAISRLFAERRVGKVICSFPKALGSTVFDDLYRAGEIELELVPQGTLAERIRAAGAGIAAFYTRTAVGTDLAAGKPIEVFDGQEYVLERALHADFALVKAHCADTWGNLIYRKTARNFGPIMLPAARVAVVEVDTIVPRGAFDPEVIVTPSLYVDRVLSLSAGTEGQKVLGESA
jgi:3-oxoadipate CoA-transferase, alpha subunit